MNGWIYAGTEDGRLVAIEDRRCIRHGAGRFWGWRRAAQLGEIALSRHGAIPIA